MSTLRANTLKPITSGNSLVLQGDSGGSGVSGPSIDSNGDVDFSQNTNAKVKLPSGGGIYESDGSTEILTESGGAVTLKNTTIDSNVVFPAGGTGNPISVAVIADEKSATSDGGSSTTGSYLTRDLNTEISDPDGIVSIASNQFTLGAGTYLINWSAPAHKPNEHQTLLYDITGSSILELGTSEYSDQTASYQTRSFGSFIHAITTNNVYEIRHRFAVAKGSNGQGVPANFGENIIYLLVIIYKLK